ncbi:hypothetical protein Cylst_3194 [Cylindrospermum stagnale PCC 7417]|uniref:Uncharacterized protein n=1 Tax=Cylindrospermum stagnale PCC 7417 TaxID=56107 RepID=K9X0Q7_9NOST|nr:hypothetical protein [Cylindrospermum stagnale]AFZ25357.1 hypothetical protein Cylst_3194 [Cylindrospermum stagnale PCC 7417]
MSKFRKVLKTALVNFSIFALTYAYFSQSVSAGTPFYDGNCRTYERTSDNFKMPAVDTADLLTRKHFITNRKEYFLTVVHFQDGTAVLCITQSNYRYMKKLNNVQKIQGQIIYQVVQKTKRNATFLITLKERNRSNVPITVYHLNLNNPDKPVVTLVKRR